MSLLSHALVIALLKLIEATFLLVKILDEAPTPFFHLKEARLQSLPQTHARVCFTQVLTVPHVVHHELLNARAPKRLYSCVAQSL